MKSKTLIGKQVQRKTNSGLVETIVAGKKAKGWLEVAGVLAGPRKNHRNANIEDIDKFAKDSETIVVCGKVLSQGEIGKKVKVVALKFSDRAKEKLLKAKCEVVLIKDEIKKNPEAKGVKILKSKLKISTYPNLNNKKGNLNK